jgi:hypothetical protein
VQLVLGRVLTHSTVRDSKGEEGGGEGGVCISDVIKVVIMFSDHSPDPERPAPPRLRLDSVLPLGDMAL